LGLFAGRFAGRARLDCIGALVALWGALLCMASIMGSEQEDEEQHERAEAKDDLLFWRLCLPVKLEPLALLPLGRLAKEVALDQRTGSIHCSRLDNKHP